MVLMKLAVRGVDVHFIIIGLPEKNIKRVEGLRAMMMRWQ
jgi:hypothetical protein